MKSKESEKIKAKLLKKRILLKLTGELFKANQAEIDFDYARNIAQQIKQLQDSFVFSVVVGGGNIIRGSINNTLFKEISVIAQHQAGMLGTYINSIFLADIFTKENLECEIISPYPFPSISEAPNFIKINQMLNQGKILIFAGGTGSAFLSTDTAAILRALYTDSKEIWKLTKVDGVYDKDPMLYANAKKIQNLSYVDAINQNLKIMDKNALVLAEQHKLSLRFFNIFSTNALLEAASDEQFGSIIK